MMNAITKQKIKPGYKKTPIGMIPEDWEVKKLGSITNYFKGNAFKSMDYCPVGTRIVRVSDLSKNKITTDKPIFIDNSKKNFDKYKLFENDLIFTTVGSKPPLINSIVGRVIRVSKNDEGSLLNQNAVCLSGKEKLINKRFLHTHFQVKRYYNFIKTIYRGNANQANITIKDLFKYKLPIPPLPEQKSIADCLSTWDAGIEKLTQLIQAKKQQKKGLMQQLLTGTLRLRSASGEKFDGEWKEVKIKDILKRISRRIKWDDEEYYELISVRRRSGGIFVRETLQGKEIRTKSLFDIKEGDFLISKMQIVHGASAVVTKEYEGMKVSGSYIVLIPKDKKKLNMSFFNYFSTQPLFYHLTYRSSYGVHIEKMTFRIDLLMKESIKIPLLKEQTAIAEILQTADKEIELLEQKLSSFQQQKKGLMQVLLTGEKRLI